MATSIYFCTSCGEPQPEDGTFCTNCGTPIAAGDVPSGMAGAPAMRPKGTVRLPQAGATPAVSTGASAATGIPPTTALPPPPARTVKPAAAAARRLTPRLLAIGGAALALLVVAGFVLTRGLPFGRGSGIDRVVTLAQSRGGDATMVLMRSDGSSKVTLFDEPGARGGSFSGHFFVSYALGENAPEQARGSSLHGAAVLANQQRILFWYPTPDGMEIRSSDLDGGDVVKMAQALPASGMVIPDQADKILLIEQEPNAAKLSLVSLRGQMTPLVQNAVEINGTISPDGKHVAYSQRDDQGRYKLMVVDDTGANAIEVARDLQSASMDFSSDSSKLFITRRDADGSSFLVANADGQNPIVLDRSADGGRGDVANGRLIYEVGSSGATSLFTSDLNGEDRVEIVRGADGLFWSLTPDRKQIIFAQKRGGRFMLQISDFRRDQLQELKRGDGWLFWRHLDNGRVLVVRYGSDSSSGVTISTVKPDGGDEQVLKRDMQNADVDVAGDMIVVAGQANGRGALFLFGGQEPVTLDDEADAYSSARITPDGRIIYTALFKSGPVTYIVDRNGKQKKLLAEDATIVATGF